MTIAIALVESTGHAYPGHEEAPSRFQRLGDWDSKPYAADLRFLTPNPAPYEAVKAVHSDRMLTEFKAACLRGPGITDYAPTYVTPASYELAFLAAGAALDCTQEVLAGRSQNAFAIVRPPGHHAEPEAAMGFCLLNNIAIAARWALSQGVGKILIVDFDAHHGNGTQAAFLNEPRAAFLSTQQENIYPFRSGFVEDAPHALGRIVNLPLPARSGDAAFGRLAGQVLTPLVERFLPDMIFVSAGFDSHWNDPLAELGLSSAGYHSYAQSLAALAREHCDGRIVFVLEGGYNPDNIATGVDAILAALTSGQFLPQDPSPYPEPDCAALFNAVCARHGFG